MGKAKYVAYVGTYTHGNSKGIHIYDVDVEEGTLDNYIHFLRRRLKTVKSGLSVRTVRGVGYQIG